LKQNGMHVSISFIISEEFKLNVGVRQGRALSPPLFIAVVEFIHRKSSTKISTEVTK